LKRKKNTNVKKTDVPNFEHETPKCILVLADRVLSYLEPGMKCVRDASTVSRESAFLIYLHAIPRKMLEPLEKLRDLVKKCKEGSDSAWIEQMVREYFPAAENLPKYDEQADLIQNKRGLMSCVRQAYNTASELLMMERLFSRDPDEWPEAKIKQKEDRYLVKLLQKSKDFLESVVHLEDQIKKVSENKNVSIKPGTYKFVRALCSDCHLLSCNNADVIDYKMAFFCDRFGLSGLSWDSDGHIKVEIKALSFDYYLSYESVSISSRIQIDITRDFPSDYLRVLQARQYTPPDSFTLQSSRKNNLYQYDEDELIALRECYFELCRGDLSSKELFAELNKKIMIFKDNISIELITRGYNRLLRELGLPSVKEIRRLIKMRQNNPEKSKLICGDSPVI